LPLSPNHHKIFIYILDYTQKVTDTIEKYPQEELTGILSVVFYYNNPAKKPFIRISKPF